MIGFLLEKRKIGLRNTITVPKRLFIPSVHLNNSEQVVIHIAFSKLVMLKILFRKAVENGNAVGDRSEFRYATVARLCIRKIAIDRLVDFFWCFAKPNPVEQLTPALDLGNIKILRERI